MEEVSVMADTGLQLARTPAAALSAEAALRGVENALQTLSQQVGGRSCVCANITGAAFPHIMLQWAPPGFDFGDESSLTVLFDSADQTFCVETVIRGGGRAARKYTVFCRSDELTGSKLRTMFKQFHAAAEARSTVPNGRHHAIPEQRRHGEDVAVSAMTAVNASAEDPAVMQSLCPDAVG
jgi:hypothetical protein